MTPKDIEITTVALLKSIIESQASSDEWKTKLDLATRTFRENVENWPSARAVNPSGAAAPSAPSSGPSGGPSPRATGGLPVFVVVEASDVKETKNGKKYRTFLLRNDHGDEQKVGFFESKFETFTETASVNAGDQITATIDVRGEYTNGNALRVKSRGTALPPYIPF